MYRCRGRGGRGRYRLACWLSKGVSMSFQVLLNGIETVMVLTLIILKWRALNLPSNRDAKALCRGTLEGAGLNSDVAPSSVDSVVCC